MSGDPFGDEFWDSQPVEAPKATVPPLALYTKVLKEVFPHSRYLVAGTDKVNKTFAVLGSHWIGVGSKPATAPLEGFWSRSLGTMPLPISRWDHLPPMESKEQRITRSPQDFRLWLHKVIAQIIRISVQDLQEALHQDKWIDDFRKALQIAHDLHLLGITPDQFYEELGVTTTPLFAWQEGKEPRGFGVPLRRRGLQVGFLLAGFKNGRWIYGADINISDLLGDAQPNLHFKHQASAMLAPHSQQEAFIAAEKLYWTKTYEWLVQMGNVYPHRRAS
jgi:hypothetical protein